MQNLLKRLGREGAGKNQLLKYLNTKALRLPWQEVQQADFQNYAYLLCHHNAPQDGHHPSYLTFTRTVCTPV